MSQQTIKQQARRAAREMAEKRRKERVERERRIEDLAVQVMTAIGERDAAVGEAERRAGKRAFEGFRRPDQRVVPYRLPSR